MLEVEGVSTIVCRFADYLHLFGDVVGKNEGA